MAKEHGFRDYSHALSRPAWRDKRVGLRPRALDRAGYRCEHRARLLRLRCPARGRLEVHHLTYKNFPKEQLDDLQVLCRLHHARAGRKPWILRAVWRNRPMRRFLFWFVVAVLLVAVSQGTGIAPAIATVVATLQSLARMVASLLL